MPQTILAARYEQTYLPLSFGYLEVCRLPAKALVVIYQGLLGEDNEDVGEALLDHLWCALRSGEAEVVIFNHLDEKSFLLKAAAKKVSRTWREKKLRWIPHWEMELPLDVEGILGNLKANHRRHIRSKERKLNNTFSNNVLWRWENRFENLPLLCAQLELVAKNTYHRGLRTGFINNDEYRRRFELFARRGQLRMQLLEIKSQIRAFWIGTIYNNIFYASETGYDPDLREFEVGTLGLLKTADGLLREGVRKIDFGFGDAPYKQRFGNKCWQEGTLRMFAPNAKGLALRHVLQGGAVLENMARGLVARGGFGDRLKTAWRRRLTRS